MARRVAREGTRPYLPKGKDGEPEQTIYNLKVQGVDGKTWYARTTGAKDEVVANLIADLMHETRMQKLAAVIDMITTQRVLSLSEYFSRITAMRERPEYADLNLRALCEQLIVDVKSPGLKKLHEQWAETMKPEWQYVRNSGYFLTWLKKQPGGTELPVTMFDAGTAADWLKAVEASGEFSAETRRKFRVALSQFGQWLAVKKFLPHTGNLNPIKRENGVKAIQSATERINKAFAKYYEIEEIAQMVDEAGKGSLLAACIALCFSGAADWSAMEALRVQDINRQTGVISLFDPELGIAGKDRSIPLHRMRKVFIAHQFCWDAILAYLTTREGEEWFVPRAAAVKRYKKPVLKRGIPRCTEKALREPLIALCEKLHIEHEGWHKFRHSFAVYWIFAGCERGLTGKFTKEWGKKQMGHAPGSVLWENTYGKIKRYDDDDAFGREMSGLAPATERDLLQYLRPTVREKIKAALASVHQPDQNTAANRTITNENEQGSQAFQVM